MASQATAQQKEAPNSGSANSETFILTFRLVDDGTARRMQAVVENKGVGVVYRADPASKFLPKDGCKYLARFTGEVPGIENGAWAELLEEVSVTAPPPPAPKPVNVLPERPAPAQEAATIVAHPLFVKKEKKKAAEKKVTLPTKTAVILPPPSKVKVEVNKNQPRWLRKSIVASARRQAFAG